MASTLTQKNATKAFYLALKFEKSFL